MEWKHDKGELLFFFFYEIEFHQKKNKKEKKKGDNHLDKLSFILNESVEITNDSKVLSNNW